MQTSMKLKYIKGDKLKMKDHLFSLCCFSAGIDFTLSPYDSISSGFKIRKSHPQWQAEWQFIDCLFGRI